MAPTLAPVSATLLLLAIGLLIAAALHDVAARTIPDQLPLCLAVIGVALRLIDHDLFPALAVSLAVGIVALLCWRLGFLGGGDVKLLVAATLLLPAGLVPAAMTATGLAGILLALPYLILRRRLKRPRYQPLTSLVRRSLRAERFRLGRGGPLPYGVAIAAGVITALLGGLA